jgi:excisionase family DNA binding protein
MIENQDIEQLATAIKMLSLATKNALTKDDCATLLGLTEDALNKRIAARTIPHYKNGGHIYFKREEVEAEILAPRCRRESISEQQTHLIRCATRNVEKIKRNNPLYHDITRDCQVND